ncbi:MAG: hypothetical protein U0R50_09000 [Gaiellales bacterium]
MLRPLLTITCDCGTVGHARIGETWTCTGCGRAWDMSRVPRDEYETLMRKVRTYSLLTLGPPVTAAAILVPLAVVVNIGYAFLLFVLVMAWGLLVAPQLRKRARKNVLEAVPRWKLEAEPRPEQPPER